LAYACAGRLEEGKAMLKKCAAETANLTSADMRLKLVGLASKIKDKPALFCLGRGLNYPTALEAALKIKEVSYIHATGIAAGESKHGPIALVEEGFPVIVFVPEDETKDDMISNSMEMKSRGAFVIGVSPENNEAFDFHIPVPDAGNASTIVNSVVAQILAYYLAMLKGIDADKPKNLAKSVTVK